MPEIQNSNEEMDPNVSGMDHKNIVEGDRPLGIVLTLFGLATMFVLFAAVILRRKDHLLKLEKLKRLDAIGNNN